jgi:hypothetical protein
MPPGYLPPASAPSPEDETGTSRFIPGHLWGDPSAVAPLDDSPIVATVDSINDATSMQVDPPPPSQQEQEEEEGDATILRKAEQELMEPRNEHRLFLGAPFIPTSTQGSPKMALNALYGKDMGQTPITEESYFYWRRGKEFTCQFTCFVVCPATYEIFPAGRYQSMALTASGANIGITVDDETGIVWYSRKKEAAQGAAALRYDCWYYRQWQSRNPQAPKIRVFSMDEPYGSPDDDRPSRVLALIPSNILESIQASVERWKVAAEERVLAQERDAMVEVEAEVEATAYRNAYLETRGEGQMNDDEQ